MPKILVRGGAGFIGSAVVDLFLSRGYEVVILDDPFTGRLSNLNPQAAFYQLDIRSLSVREVFANEIFFALAKVGETRQIYLDATEAAKELGWTPTLIIEQGLEKTVSYFRDSEMAL